MDFLDAAADYTEEHTAEQIEKIKRELYRRTEEKE